MTVDEIEKLGAALADCRREGKLGELPLIRISSIEEAEAVQAAALDAYGGVPSGYSMQATSALTRRLLRCAEPIFGVLVDSDLLYNGAKIRLPYGTLGAGGGFSFIFGRPYPGDGEKISRETVINALTTCRLTIELLGRRVPGSIPLNDLNATADFALNVAFIEGAPIDDWTELDLAAVEMSARINGKVAASGRGANVMGHPLDTLVWLAQALSTRGRELEAGECVTTGSCLGILQVIPGQTFEIGSDSLGHVSAAFV